MSRRRCRASGVLSPRTLHTLTHTHVQFDTRTRGSISDPAQLATYPNSLSHKLCGNGSHTTRNSIRPFNTAIQYVRAAVRREHPDQLSFASPSSLSPRSKTLDRLQNMASPSSWALGLSAL